MGNNKKPRKQKTFRHSTTFYRKLKQQTESATLKYYYPVNKQPLPSVQKNHTNFRALLSTSLQANSKSIVFDDSEDVDDTSCDEIETKINCVHDRQELFSVITLNWRNKVFATWSRHFRNFNVTNQGGRSVVATF